MKVAKILGLYRLVITKKCGPHLSVGDILFIGTEDVVDPDSREVLGTLAGLRVKVIEVYPKFVVAETFRIGMGEQPSVAVNIGDRAWAYCDECGPIGDE